MCAGVFRHLDGFKLKESAPGEHTESFATPEESTSSDDQEADLLKCKHGLLVCDECDRACGTEASQPEDKCSEGFWSGILPPGLFGASSTQQPETVGLVYSPAQAIKRHRSLELPGGSTVEDDPTQEESEAPAETSSWMSMLSLKIFSESSADKASTGKEPSVDDEAETPGSWHRMREGHSAAEAIKASRLSLPALVDQRNVDCTLAVMTSRRPAVNELESSLEAHQVWMSPQGVTVGI